MVLESEKKNDKVASTPDVVAPLKSPEVPDPTNFVRGRIQIRYVETKNLPSTELFGGKNDPYVIIQCGDWIQQTSVEADGKWDMTANESKWNWEMTRDAMKSSEVFVKVVDDNTILDDVLIGSGSTPLSLLAKEGVTGEDFLLNIPLSKGRKAGGSVKITVRLYNAEIKEDSPTGEDVDPYDDESFVEGIEENDNVFKDVQESMGVRASATPSHNQHSENDITSKAYDGDDDFEY